MTTAEVHTCHATGCTVPVPPRMLMCRPHWHMVPAPIRARVWKAYRPGQETDKRPSHTYLQVAAEAIRAVADKERQAPR